MCLVFCSLFSLSSSSLPSGEPLCSTTNPHHDALPHHGPETMESTSHGLKPMKSSDKQIFPSLNYLSQVFGYSNKIMTNTSCIMVNKEKNNVVPYLRVNTRADKQYYLS
jgi:hypothetical protein